jgi:UPF0716 family protein affecting phage T7 exclusion
MVAIGMMILIPPLRVIIKKKMCGGQVMYLFRIING